MQHERCLVLPGFPIPMPLRCASGFVLRPVSSFLSCRACAIHAVLQVPHSNFLEVNNHENNNTSGTIYRCEEHQTSLHYLSHDSQGTVHPATSQISVNTPLDRIPPSPPPPLSPQQSHRPIFPSIHPAPPIPPSPSLTKRLSCRPQPHRLAMYASHGSRHSPSRSVPSLFLLAAMLGPARDIPPSIASPLQ